MTCDPRIKGHLDIQNFVQKFTQELVTDFLDFQLSKDSIHIYNTNLFLFHYIQSIHTKICFKGSSVYTNNKTSII